MMMGVIVGKLTTIRLALNVYIQMCGDTVTDLPQQGDQLFVDDFKFGRHGWVACWFDGFELIFQFVVSQLG